MSQDLVQVPMGTPRQHASLCIEHVPGAEVLISWPDRAGFTWAGRFRSRDQAIVALLRRGLAVDGDEVVS